MTAKGRFRLVSVNTAPERAQRVLGRVADLLKNRYIIVHEANCEKIEEVGPKVTELQPDVLVSASMWTEEEARQIHDTARAIKPDIKLHAIPHGLQVERGPEGVVEYLVERVPALLDNQVVSLS